jgi:hypothetical protein
MYRDQEMMKGLTKDEARKEANKRIGAEWKLNAA